MKRISFAFGKPNVAQRGAAVVELALVVPLFLVLLFGTMEFGRLIYLWNTVQEVTRSAARQAVVTNFRDADQIACIKLAAVFRRPLSPPCSGSVGLLPAASEITSAMVNISYLDAGKNVIPRASWPTDPGDNIAACLDATRTASCIRFVQVCVSNDSACPSDQSQSIAYVPMIGFLSATAGSFSPLSLNISIPNSTVIMPAESLGYRPSI